MSLTDDGTFLALGVAALLAGASTVAQAKRSRQVSWRGTLQDLDREQIDRLFGPPLHGAAGEFGSPHASRDWEFDWDIGSPVRMDSRRYRS